MNNIVVIGGGGHARVVISILKRLGNYNILGYTDPVNHGPLLGVDYLGGDERLESLISKNSLSDAVLGLGNAVNLERRRQMLEILKMLCFRLPFIISPSAYINEAVNLGDASVVIDGAIIHTGVRIGQGCIINTKASIDHDCEIGDFVHIAPGATLCGGVTVGEGCFIGAGATVLEGLNIASRTLIAAGAVVTNDCLEPGTYMGVPAKIT